MELKNTCKDGVITVFANTELYSKDTIFKCLYWYGNKFHTNVSFYNKDIYKIELSIIDTSQAQDIDLNLYLSKLERDLIDFNLRQIVNRETQAIRELLIAKAFANGDFDELPIGDIEDPVGFDVEKI